MVTVNFRSPRALSGNADMSANTETLQFLGFFAPLCLLCAALALTDIRRGIIPNGFNLSIAGLGLLKAVVAGGAMAALELGCEGERDQQIKPSIPLGAIA